MCKFEVFLASVWTCCWNKLRCRWFAKLWCSCHVTVMTLLFSFQTMNLGLIGSSLLDFALLTGGTMSQLASVFTWRAVMGLTASLLLGPLADKIDRYFLCSAALFCSSILTAVAPLCSRIEALLIVLALPEFFGSLIGMGKNNDSKSTSACEIRVLKLACYVIVWKRIGTCCFSGSKLNYYQLHLTIVHDLFVILDCGEQPSTI